MKLEFPAPIKGFLNCSVFVVSLLLLNACADSKVAIELANSFDSPLETKESKKFENKNSDEKAIIKAISTEPEIIQKSKKSPFTVKPSIKTTYKEISTSKKIKKSLKVKKNDTHFSPQPYRIIIRLSGANPSAPAETVTRALRDAGVIFEVEKIERFEKKSSFREKTREERQF